MCGEKGAKTDSNRLTECNENSEIDRTLGKNGRDLMVVNMPVSHFNYSRHQ